MKAILKRLEGNLTNTPKRGTSGTDGLEERTVPQAQTRAVIGV